MRELRDRVDGLSRLHRIDDPIEQRGTFREAFATLAARAATLTPAPLEGIDPHALRESMNAATDAGLLDELGWLSSAHAIAALYEIAAVLPPGSVKRALGRRVLVGLHDGDAQTFVLLATHLARSSKRGLSGPGMKARVALALDLPIGAGLGVDALALALVSRRDLEQEWLTQPSEGSLPARRLAARLLDRAARAINLRASMGDESPLALLERPSLVAAWTRLLRDREPLVWRHVASARGQLAGILPRFDEEIDADLDPEQSPTEWRRAATSLAATLAFEPERALERCKGLLQSAIFQRDRGIAASMLQGLARAAETEPDAAERMIVMLLRSGGIDAIETLLSFREERLGQELGEWSSRLALSRLKDAEIVGRPGEDDGHDALLSVLQRALEKGTTRVTAVGMKRPALDGAREAPEGAPEGALKLKPKPSPKATVKGVPVRAPATVVEAGSGPSLLELLADARETFLEKDARTAHGRSIEILAALEVTLARFEAAREDTPTSRHESLHALRALDAVLFETSTLVDLLTLDHRESAKDDGPRAVHPALALLGEIVARLSERLIELESEPVTDGDVAHRTLRIRRLRVLLHLVDADTAVGELSTEVRARHLRIARLLLERASSDAPSPLRRIVHAAAARACEAVLREEGADVSEIFVAVVMHLRTAADLTTFAEASMMPEIEALFRAYANVIERGERVARTSGTHVAASIDALRGVVRHLPLASGPRVEAIRAGLLALANTLADIDEAGSLAEVVGEFDVPDADASQHSYLLSLAEIVDGLARLVEGSLRRMGYLRPKGELRAGPALRLLDVAALQTVRGDGHTYVDMLETVFEPLARELPLHLAELVSTVLGQTLALPRFGAIKPKRVGPVALVSRRDRGLPPWLPPSRMLGGFYVLRALGSGAVGSVFVARRGEERTLESATLFALKVPEYEGTVARTLGEDEFFQMFREEAGALLAVPAHENLARLVTFDAGARPKPILVMELVEGPTLERLIETRGLAMDRALSAALGIAAGLEAMHRVGVGHLDLKPSNVILRDPDGPGPIEETPVLVDFGLAGRNVRPGCATANYGAPEVWGLVPKGYRPEPAKVDVYAFACLVYELLFGVELFDADSDLATVSLHLQHDGNLPALEPLLRDAALRPLGELLRSALRQDPRKRVSIDVMAATLHDLADTLLERPWPLTSA